MRLKRILENHIRSGNLPEDPAIFFHKLEIETSNKATTDEFKDIINLLCFQIENGNIHYVSTILSYLSMQETLKDLFFKFALEFSVKYNAIQLLKILAKYSYAHLYYCTVNSVFGFNIHADIPLRDMIAITNNSEFGRAALSLLSEIPTHPRSITVGNLVYQNNLKSFTQNLTQMETTSEIFQIKDIALELLNTGMEKFKISPSQDTIKFVAFARYLAFKEPANPCELYKVSLPDSLEMHQMQYHMLLIDLMSNLGKRIRNNYFTSTIISSSQAQITDIVNSMTETHRSCAISYLENCLDFPELKAEFKERAAEISSKNLPKFLNITDDQQKYIADSFLQMEGISSENKLYGCLTAIVLFDELVFKKPVTIREEGFLRGCHKLATYVGQKIARRNTFCFDITDLVAKAFCYDIFSKSLSKDTVHLAGNLFDEYGAGLIFERILKSCSFTQEAAGLQKEDLMQL